MTNASDSTAGHRSAIGRFRPLTDHLRTAFGPAWRWTRAHGDRVFPVLAALLLAASIVAPYWQLKLHAPQYPNGLNAQIFVYKVEGDVAEIDGLNHYIGMRSLGEGGEFERAVAPYALMLVAALALLVAVRRRRTWLAAIPAICFPVVFTADLFYWLYSFGHELDPTAALSSSIGEFTPTVLGTGYVGQFKTTAFYEYGFGMAALAAVLLIAAVAIRLRPVAPAASSEAEATGTAAPVETDG